VHSSLSFSDKPVPLSQAKVNTYIKDMYEEVFLFKRCALGEGVCEDSTGNVNYLDLHEKVYIQK